MKIAVEGCAHGELELIYKTIQELETENGFKVDLLICCGDFQSSRNENDLKCMAIPAKYHDMCSFYKYYKGELIAPILTIFVGGNHEASNYLQELPFGGWVAPNIYYMGYAGVINVAGIRIGGLSGIYKPHDYMKGHFEFPPYNDNTKRSVYHIRNIEVFRLKQISDSIDIFVSHDWPTNVWKYGNEKRLIRDKPFFKDDIESGKLGSKPCEELLNTLKPSYYFAAHLHCKFSALIPHDNDTTFTKFLALDKCLPKRRFLQILNIPHNSSLPIEIQYDLEWMTILKQTNHLNSVKSVPNYMPSSLGKDRWNFTPTEDEKIDVLSKLEALEVPLNFVKTAPAYDGTSSIRNTSYFIEAVSNPQTVLLCEKLGLDDPLTLLLNLSYYSDDQTSEHPLNKSSFIADTPVNSQKRLRLSLPAPQSRDTSLENMETDSQVKDNQSVDIETKCVSLNEPLENELSETVDDSLETGEQYSTDDPDMKKSSVFKFKRRNENLYKSKDSS